MKKRRVLLGALSLTLLVLVAGLTWLLLPRAGDDITAENYERIREGMTEAEVESVFGCPAGNYGGKKAKRLAIREALVKVCDEAQQEQERNLRWMFGNAGQGQPMQRLVLRLWVGNEHAILVGFWRGRTQEWYEESVADQPVDWEYRLRRLLPW
jgi:hypothetical protein